LENRAGLGMGTNDLDNIELLAYGLFTTSIAGSPVAIGSDADAGRRLAFWQDRYHVQAFTRQELPDDDLLGAVFGSVEEAVATKLLAEAIR
jgi:hypothetical protein